MVDNLGDDFCFSVTLGRAQWLNSVFEDVVEYEDLLDEESFGVLTFEMTVVVVETSHCVLSLEMDEVAFSGTEGTSPTNTEGKTLLVVVAA